MKLTSTERQLAQTIANINNITISKAIAIVIRRRNRRLHHQYTTIGSVQRAQPYWIV